MRYLTGATTGAPAVLAELEAGRIGYLKNPDARNTLDRVAVWALDNGCFTGSYPGDDAYLALLDKLDEHRSRCLFVVVPDVLGDGPATLERFPTMAARIRARGWPVALVAQDGMRPEELPSDLDWLFVGGSTAWKLGPDARSLIAEARRRDVPVHVGRVNSARRFRYFATLGATSVDGTYLAFGPDVNLVRVRGWLAEDAGALW